MITITGTVGTDGKYLVTGMPVTTKADSVLKMSFENKTAGTNLALFAGTYAEFTAGTPGIQLSDSGGPGYIFLTIVGAKELEGKVIYVKREVGTADSQFSLIVD